MPLPAAYDYNIDTQLPKRQSAAFSRLTTKSKPDYALSHSLDFATLPKTHNGTQMPSLKKRCGRDKQDPFTVSSGVLQNIELDIKQSKIPIKSRHSQKSCFEYDFGRDFDNKKTEILELC